MPQYKYTARDTRGKAVTGTLSAPSTEGLADQLKRMGYLVTRSKEVADSGSGGSLLSRLRGVGHDEMALFSVQLAKMVQVGIPLLTALETVTQQTEHPRLKEAVGDIVRNVESGMSFSEALKKHPGIFSDLYVNMVHAGEISGKLEEVLRRLAEFTKHQAAMREQIKTAMTYPVVLLVVGIAVMVFLLMGVIPKFMTVFLEAGVELPLPTRILYQLSELLKHYGLWFVGFTCAGGFSLRSYMKTTEGRRRVDSILLRLPLTGDLTRKAAISRLSRTLDTLLSSGVSVLEALNIAQKTCGNAVIADVMGNAEASVRQGGTISDPIQVSRQFPPMVVQMIHVGETSGTLDHMLREIAEHYNELIQHSIKRLTVMIEPVFLIIMGGMVAGIMASVLLPLFRMINVVQ